MHRAYSLLHVKAQDDDQRILTGVATTPTPDRVGDVVEPRGVKFKNPLPLLLFHDSTKPVGTVRFEKATDEGITFTARLPRIDEPGTLRDRVEEAWQSVKHGLIKGVSIGFRALDDGIELLRSGGVRFTATEVLELSLVPIPANAEAVISTIKAIDAPHLAASGMGGERKHVGTPGGTGAVVRPAKKDAPTTMKTTNDKLQAFKAEKDAKTARMNDLMSGADVVTLDAEQQSEFDQLDAEIKEIDGHIARLDRLDQMNRAAAVAVNGGSQAQASASRGAHVPVVSVKANREPGIGMARTVIAQMASYMDRMKGGSQSALEIAMKRWPSDTEVHLHIKTNIAAGTTTDTNWATELVEPTTLGSEFLEFLRAQTIIGKFGQNGVPSLRNLPFNVRLARMTSGLTGYWVGEGLGKPVSKGAIDAVTLPYNKVAALTVITKELARFSSPSAERVVRDDLARSISARIDADFVDPAIAAVSGVKPASITNGLTALSSAGTSADNARTDIMNLIEYFVLNHMDVSSLVILMPNTLALALSILRNSLGQQEFPGLTLNGGTLEGIPVVTSQHLASSASYGNMVVALSANDIGLADDGAVSVDVSGEASLEMTDTPLGDSGTPTASQTAVVSMFQTNSLAILAERFITWKKLRSTAVVFMDDVNWGAIGSPV